jgi:hypothetical protein
MHIFPHQIHSSNPVMQWSVREKCRELKSEPSNCSNLQSASQSAAVGDVTFLAPLANQCTCDVASSVCPGP